MQDYVQVAERIVLLELACRQGHIESISHCSGVHVSVFRAQKCWLFHPAVF